MTEQLEYISICQELYKNQDSKEYYYDRLNDSDNLLIYLFGRHINLFKIISCPEVWVSRSL